MPKLYILRHGIALDHATPGMPDDDRPLTAKGEKRIRSLAISLRRLDLEIDLILTSPLPRARSTALIVARMFNLEKSVENSDLLRPGTDLTALQSMLAEHARENLMIVGHNPCLSQLLSLLVLGEPHPLICDLKKGGIAALTPPATPVGPYELVWLAPPRIFRRLDTESKPEIDAAT